MKKTQEELNRELLVSDDRIEAATEAIVNGADVNTTHPNGRTPLHYAATRGYTKMLRLLLNNGADVYAKDKYGDTPLDDALAEGRTICAAILREHIAKLEAKPESPLRFKTKDEFINEFGPAWRRDYMIVRLLKVKYHNYN